MSEINEFISIHIHYNFRILINADIIAILKEHLNHYKFSNLILNKLY